MNQINQHIPEDDLALFALALMPPEEAAFTQAHLKHCDQCRGEVARMQGDLVAYAFTAEMQDPPAEARTRLLDAVAQEKKLHVLPPAAEPVLAARNSNLLDRDTRSEPVIKRQMGFAGWAGWAIAAGVAGFAGWQFYQGQNLREQLAEETANVTQVTAETARAQRVMQALTDPGAMQVALHLASAANTPPKPEGHASYNPNKGELVFVATHLGTLQADKTYELWVLPAAEGGKPVPAGLFKPDANGNASVVLPDLPKRVEAKGFGVTIEAEGGSPTPTMPIVLASS
ncbi:MAG TPA: anti-sigma factor [Acidobacteriaceae bacterium]|nr:anti-sigma factor [Acidobacteriaceae bacterium]